MMDEVWQAEDSILSRNIARKLYKINTYILKVMVLHSVMYLILTVQITGEKYR